MGLIKCSECGRDVSDKATACPACGAPIADAAVGASIQTIEKTSKKLKAHYAIAVVVFFIGLIWFILNFVYAANTNQSISAIPIYYLFPE